MAVKKRPGRKPKNPADRVQATGVYLTISEKKKIEKKHGSLTKALRVAVLPGC